MGQSGPKWADDGIDDEFDEIDDEFDEIDDESGPKWANVGQSGPKWDDHVIDDQFYECGQKSRDFLLNLIKNKKIKCKKKDFDRYKRIIAICYANDVNINREMVRSGWAIAYRRYSKIFVIDEDFAKKEKKGIWSGEFIQPSEWRRSNKLRK